MASIATARFPDPSQLFAYNTVGRLCEPLDAEMCVAAAGAADPTACGPEAKAWLDKAIWSPPSDYVHAADLAHFRNSRPEVVNNLEQELASALGVEPAAVWANADVKIAVSMARRLAAWAPDLLVSFYGYSGSLWAHFAASLLGVPRVWITYDSGPDKPGEMLLNRLHAANADLVVTHNAQVRRELGGDDSTRWIDMEQPSWEVRLVERVQSILARRTDSADRKDLGPTAAFLTSRATVEPPPSITPFVVIGAERTGSNLLVEMLSSHPRVYAAGELFNTRLIEEGKLDNSVPVGVTEEEILELRTKDPAACFDRLVSAAASAGSSACGFKLLYYHGLAENRIVDHLVGMQNLHVVHLVRDDAVERWISQARAERSDRWWSATDAASPDRPSRQIELDPGETLLRLEFNRQLEERFQATFSGCAYLELSYEQLTQDLEGQTRRVQQFLGLEPAPLTAASVKTGRGDPRSGVSNWDQLVAAFADTRWRRLFRAD